MIKISKSPAKNLKSERLRVVPIGILHSNSKVGTFDMKICKKCGEIKSVDNFYKATNYGYRGKCKECISSDARDNRKTVDGLIGSIYRHQKYRSKIKGYSQPSYTKHQLKKWICQRFKFLILYDNWVKSGYNKNLTPSIDRKNDYLPYDLDNIQLMTWGDNRSKAHKDTFNGVNNKRSKAVLQYSLDGTFIKEYYSIMKASRETGIWFTNISKNCKGKLNTSGGYIWKYKK